MAVVGDREVQLAVGRGLLELRRGLAQVRQEDVATAARELGLPWMQGTVASVELGRRRLSIVELLLLPEVLYLVTLSRISIAQLAALSGRYRLELTPAVQIESSNLHVQVEGVVDQVMLEDFLRRRVCASIDRPAESVARAEHELFGRSLLQEIQARVEALPGIHEPGGFTYGIHMSGYFTRLLGEQLAQQIDGGGPIGEVVAEVVFEPIDEPTPQPARGRRR